MVDMTTAGKNITARHFKVIVDGFKPVFHIHRLLVKGMYSCTSAISWYAVTMLFKAYRAFAQLDSFWQLQYLNDEFHHVPIR